MNMMLNNLISVVTQFVLCCLCSGRIGIVRRDREMSL